MNDVKISDTVKQKLDYLNSHEYRKMRSDKSDDITDELNKLPVHMRAPVLLRHACEAEKPILFGSDDIFGFNRYRIKLPKHGMYGRSHYGNVTVDYERLLRGGLNGILTEIEERYAIADTKAKEFYEAGRECISSCIKIAERYRLAAEENGNVRLASALKRVPFYGARDYYEACVMLRFIQYILRLNGTAHVTLGRFDKYMKPYFDASIQNGVNLDDILQVTQLFFISLNFDSDIYPGVQTGDNGQSMVLGGCDNDGVSLVSELTEICLAASQSLRLIDPKINLRVNKNTPITLYERGTQLTKQGLGFPQYCNDDVVITGLVALGYDEIDARNYSVAACWEFIVSGCGADIPNIEVMNFPLVVDRTIRCYPKVASFENFMKRLHVQLNAECEALIYLSNEICRQNYSIPEPLLSLFVYPCIQRGRDITEGGAKYRNFGIHGAGIANAADAIVAIKKLCYEQKKYSLNDIIVALNADFVGYEGMRAEMLSQPKMGNNDDEVDNIAGTLMGWFSDYINGRQNEFGGIFRAGTGSAMEYIYRAEMVGATSDGRKARAPYGSSFSPSLDARLNGPLSAISSFSKFDMKRIINGGPFTIEMHDTVFRNDEGEKKVAALIKAFIDMGGHQIQINAINRETLIDAQKHPEKYPNLIVRVWGWSGYFNELDIAFQNHIIRRCEFSL